MQQTQTGLKLTEATKIVQHRIDQIENQNSRIIVILDNDPDFLHIIKHSVKDNVNIITICDTEVFKAFIQENGIYKMYIDINLDFQTGIDLAEELQLDEYFGELIFVSGIWPDDENLKRIEALKASFLHKDKLLKEIKIL